MTDGSHASVAPSQADPLGLAALGYGAADDRGERYAHTDTVSNDSPGVVWDYTTRTYGVPQIPVDLQLANATPENPVLVRWASEDRNQPPEEWWDDTTDPFEP